jgi:hypothetical protein
MAVKTKAKVESAASAPGLSKEAVALLLLEKIYAKVEHAEEPTVEWFLTLYVQCLRATAGLPLEEVLSKV